MFHLPVCCPSRGWRLIGVLGEGKSSIAIGRLRLWRGPFLCSQAQPDSLSETKPVQISNRSIASSGSLPHSSYGATMAQDGQGNASRSCCNSEWQHVSFLCLESSQCRKAPAELTEGHQVMAMVCLRTAWFMPAAFLAAMWPGRPRETTASHCVFVRCSLMTFGIGSKSIFMSINLSSGTAHYSVFRHSAGKHYSICMLHFFSWMYSMSPALSGLGGWCPVSNFDWLID